MADRPSKMKRPKTDSTRKISIFSKSIVWIVKKINKLQSPFQQTGVQFETPLPTRTAKFEKRRTWESMTTQESPILERPSIRDESPIQEETLVLEETEEFQLEVTSGHAISSREHAKIVTRALSFSINANNSCQPSSSNNTTIQGDRRHTPSAYDHHMRAHTPPIQPSDGQSVEISGGLWKACTQAEATRMLQTLQQGGYDLLNPLFNWDPNLDFWQWRETMQLFASRYYAARVATVLQDRHPNETYCLVRIDFPPDLFWKTDLGRLDLGPGDTNRWRVVVGAARKRHLHLANSVLLDLIDADVTTGAVSAAAGVEMLSSSEDENDDGKSERQRKKEERERARDMDLNRLRPLKLKRQKPQGFKLDVCLTTPKPVMQVVWQGSEETKYTLNHPIAGVELQVEFLNGEIWYHTGCEGEQRTYDVTPKFEQLCPTPEGLSSSMWTLQGN